MDGINLKQVKPAVNNPRTNFDLSFKRKFDTKFGRLYPIACIPCNPSEEFSVSYDFLTRFAPFSGQVYQDYYMSVDWFYVPNRLIWNNFENFMKGGFDGKQEFVHPYLSFNSLRSAYTGVYTGYHNLFDALDIPPMYQLNAPKDEIISSLPIAGYYRIIIDYFLGVDTPLSILKQYLLGGSNFILSDGHSLNTLALLANNLVTAANNVNPPSSTASPDQLFQLIERLYPLDYFTSARSNPQLGPVMTIPVELVNVDTTGTNTFRAVGTQSQAAPLLMTQSQGSEHVISVTTQQGNNVTINGSILNNTATIYDFYSAARIQELLTLYGYTGFTPAESIAAEFGVENRDAREYQCRWLHHRSHVIPVNEVFSNNFTTNTDTDVSVPGVATAIAKGQSADRGFKFQTQQDYGYLFGLASVYPEADYSQGLPRHYQRLDRFDYPHPKLASLGMQDIKIKELYSAATNVSEYNDTFAYTSRYGEDKVGINRVNGDLRANLSYMSDGRLFNSVNAPAFNDHFLRIRTSQNQLNRTFNAITDTLFDNPIFCDFNMNIFANRPLPKYGLFSI